ncbi:MAG: amidohydrolase family protein [Rhizobiales bacterium]|jgi:predicted TIM-barrel fold metal-dependent hydrolase|nr:amidohydrolase family protein [Hyphomicrobiales bacterium]
MLEKASGSYRELDEITMRTDTRDILAHATKQAESYEDYFLVDIDAHVTETQFWGEIIGSIDNDVIRHMGQAALERPSGNTALLNVPSGTNYQYLYGRIPHQGGLLEPVSSGEGGHHFLELARRSMDAMGLDYQVVFPTPMLTLGMHPQDDVEVALSQAYNKWMAERILGQDKRIKGLLYLPFNTPEACEKLVEQYAAHPEVIGFTVCSTRNKPVHHNQYIRLYSMIEESGKPLAFHSGFHWNDPSFMQLNRFISMHALSFAHYNMIHLTNWVINGLPERFKKLKVVWVESGLAWVPFLMQRLDHEYLMRSCEAPALKRLPSEYMREMYYTTQPLERTNLDLLKATLTAINAETQLLFASDWPHWDFDPPSSITNLPFLSEQAKRNILGLNAARIFNLEVKRMRPAARDVLASRPSVAGQS